MNLARDRIIRISQSKAMVFISKKFFILFFDSKSRNFILMILLKNLRNIFIGIHDVVDGKFVFKYLQYYHTKVVLSNVLSKD